MHTGRDPAHHNQHRQPTSSSPQRSSHSSHTTETPGSTDYTLRLQCTLPDSFQHLSPLLNMGVMWEHPKWPETALSTQQIPLLCLLSILQVCINYRRISLRRNLSRKCRKIVKFVSITHSERNIWNGNIVATAISREKRKQCLMEMAASPTERSLCPGICVM